MTRPDPWVILGLVAAAGAVALVYTAYQGDPTDTDWTDPHQPPAMIPMPVGRMGDRPCRQYGRSYPDTLASWDGTVVGDV